MSTATSTPASPAKNITKKDLGYKTFSIGKFNFERDEYFAHIYYPGNQHIIPIDNFLRALMRDVGWGFFYGTVNFDSVFGTVNHYGTVEMFVGLFNESYRKTNRHYVETFQSADLRKVFEAMLDDWTNEGFDPYAAPDETGKPFGPKHGSNIEGIEAQAHGGEAHGRPAGRSRLPDGCDGYRSIGSSPSASGQTGDPRRTRLRRPGSRVQRLGYISRSDVTWNPSVVSCVKDSQFCATTEEEALPITHGNDRVGMVHPGHG